MKPASRREIGRELENAEEESRHLWEVAKNARNTRERQTAVRRAERADAEATRLFRLYHNLDLPPDVVLTPCRNQGCPEMLTDEEVFRWVGLCDVHFLAWTEGRPAPPPDLQAPIVGPI